MQLSIKRRFSCNRVKTTILKQENGWRIMELLSQSVHRKRISFYFSEYLIWNCSIFKHEDFRLIIYMLASSKSANRKLYFLYFIGFKISHIINIVAVHYVMILALFCDSNYLSSFGYAFNELCICNFQK